MKFIHCSDIHLDSAMDTHLSPRQARERNTEICRTFSRMAEYALQEGVTAVLICGDLFDTGRISRSTVQYIFDCIVRTPSVDFLYLKGNHDEAARAFSGMELPANLKLFGEDWTQYTYGNTTIAGLELTEDNCMNYCSSLTLPEAGVNLVMLHGQISTQPGDELVCLPQLRGKHIDYLALGHLHSYQSGKLDNRGVYAYCGCLEGRGFDECGEKGFVLLEAEGNTLTHSFVPFAQRTLYDVPVDITGCTTAPELLDAVTAATWELPKESLVKITFTGSYTPDTHKDFTFLQTMLADRFYFIRFKDASRLHIDPANYENDISLKGEFVRTVLAADLPTEDKDRIICAGLAALQGEEITL